MKANELRAFIKQVLSEQEDKMRLKTGSKTPQALKVEIIETIKNIDVDAINKKGFDLPAHFVICMIFRSIPLLHMCVSVALYVQEKC